MRRRVFLASGLATVTGGLAGCGGDPPEGDTVAPATTDGTDDGGDGGTTVSPEVDVDAGFDPRNPGEVGTLDRVRLQGAASKRWSAAARDAEGVVAAHGLRYAIEDVSDPLVFGYDPADGSVVWGYGAGQVLGTAADALFVRRLDLDPSDRVVESVTGRDAVAWSRAGDLVGTTPSGAFVLGPVDRGDGDAVSATLALLDATDGERWTLPVRGRTDPSVRTAHDGGNAAYVGLGSTEDRPATLRRVGLADGAVAWTHEVEDGTAPAALVDGETAYVGTAVGPGDGETPHIQRVSAGGALEWDRALEGRPATPVWTDGSTVVAEGRVENTEAVFGVDAATGERLWTAAGHVQLGAGRPWRVHESRVGPLVAADGTREWTLDVADAYQAPEWGPIVAVEEDWIVAVDGAALVGFDPDGREERWRIGAEGQTWHAGLFDGVAYASVGNWIHAVEVG